MSIFRNENVTCFAVNIQKLETLADFVRRVREEKRLSLNDVQQQSGNKIANSYVSRIENGIVTNVTPQKLSALAKGLGVSEDEVFAVARGKAIAYEDPLDLRSLFDGWEEATQEERAATLDDLRMIAERFQRRLKERRKEAAAAVKGNKKLARVTASLHPPTRETHLSPDREGEERIFSTRKKDKKSRQA